jgi:histidinol dehydrogenase
LAKATAKEVKRQATSNPIARQSLTAHGVIFLTRDHAETLAVTNRIAAEHLTVDDRDDLAHIRNAGSIFIGGTTPQSMGDYVSGPNHVLPTGRAARVRGGLSVYDFLRIVTTQEYSAAGLATLGEAAMSLATAEGLVAHAASVAVRMASRNSGGKR